MGKIQKIINSQLVGGATSEEVYPITSTKAVYNEDNQRLDIILNNSKIVNISTAYNAEATEEILTFAEAILKISEVDRVLGFQGKFKDSNGDYNTIIFQGDSIDNWNVESNWFKGVLQSTGQNNVHPISQKAVTDALDTKIDKSAVKQVLGTSETDVISQKGVTEQIVQLKQPNEVATLVKYLYSEKTRTTDTGLQAYENALSSGLIEVSEGDILECANGHTNNWSIYDEEFTNRVVLASPAVVPAGRKYAATMYMYGGIGGGDNAVVSVIRNKISKNALDIDIPVIPTDIYNVDEKNPLSTGYYTHDTAVAVIPDNYKKNGLIIYYQENAYNVVYEFFASNNLGRWTTPSYWVRINGIDNTGMLRLTFDTDKATTRRQIPIPLRRDNLIITYKTSDGKLVVERYNYAGISDSTMGNDSNWVDISPAEYGFRVISNQLFDKRNYRDNTRFTANGVLGTFEGGKTTQDILIPDGETFVTISGLTTGWNKFMRFLDENKALISSASIAPVPYTRAIPEGAKYVTVYFDRGTDGDDIVNTFMLNWGEEVLEMDTYKEAIATINDYELYASNLNSSKDSDVTVDYIDKRFINHSKLRKLSRQVNIYEKTINSLRKIKTTSSGEVEFAIQNTTGSEIKDAVLILNLHWGSQLYDNNGNDIFLNELCNKDFSDIRFLDDSGNFLNFIKESFGNYELCPDSKIKMYMCEFDGILFGTDGAGVHISTDNCATWSLLKSGATEALGFNSLGDLFYSVVNDVYKSTKVSDYQTDTLVLSSETTVYWREQNFDIDDAGNLYLGRYQEEWDARIYKSTDNGDTWNECFYDETQQHIHTITIDRTITPNVIYAACDGSTSSSTPLGTFKSVDRGATWTKLPIPYKSDYGVFFAGNGFRLGGGEVAIKNAPSIFRTEDDINYHPIINTMLQTLRAQSLSNNIYIAGCSRGLNKYSKIFRSTDNGKSFQTVIDQQYRESETNSNGYRYGGRKIITPSGSEPQLMMVYGPNTLSSFKALRVFEGGDHYQGLFYVHVPVIPIGGTTIKIGYGYLAEDIQENVFSKPVIASHVLNIPLNEQGSIILDSEENQYNLTKFDWKEEGKRIAYLNPLFSLNEDNASVTIMEAVEIVNPFPISKNFTVNLWMNLFSSDAKIKPLIAINGYLIYIKSINLGVRNKSGDVFEIPVYNSLYTGKMLMLSIMFKDSMLQLYLNGGAIKSDELTYSPNADSDNIIILGLEDEGILSTAAITDVDVFNSILSDDEIKRLYECGKIIRPE